MYDGNRCWPSEIRCWLIWISGIISSAIWHNMLSDIWCWLSDELLASHVGLSGINRCVAPFDPYWNQILSSDIWWLSSGIRWLFSGIRCLSRASDGCPVVSNGCLMVTNCCIVSSDGCLVVFNGYLASDVCLGNQMAVKWYQMVVMVL